MISVAPQKLSPKMISDCIREKLQGSLLNGSFHKRARIDLPVPPRTSVPPSVFFYYQQKAPRSFSHFFVCFRLSLLSTVFTLFRSFSHFFCDPDCLVQPPNSRIAPKSIGEGASSLLGGWPGSPENVSCSRATPDLHRCNLGVALEQETFSGLPGHPPKRLLAPSPIDLGAIREFGGCTRQSGSQHFLGCLFLTFFGRPISHFFPLSCRHLAAAI